MRRGTRVALVVTLAVVWAWGSEPLSAAVPHLIHYQGHLVDANNTPLEGPYTLTFALYAAQTGGTAVWQEVHTNVQISGGNFEVLLGAGSPTPTPLNVDWTQSLWLSIKVGTDPELSPRQQITSVPLAIVAEELAVPVTTSTIEDDANRLVPPGAVILWTGASCPAGYTRLSTLDGKFLVGGASYAAAAGGSNTHSHGAGSYASANHQHDSPFGAQSDWLRLSTTAPFGTGANNTFTRFINISGGDNVVVPFQKTSSAGAAPITGTSESVDSRPEFATVLFCKKD